MERLRKLSPWVGDILVLPSTSLEMPSRHATDGKSLSSCKTEDSGPDDLVDTDFGNESDHDLADTFTLDRDVDVENIDKNGKAGSSLEIRPFPLGSPFFYASDVTGAFSNWGDDSDVECISPPPPSSPAQDSDGFSVGVMGKQSSIS